MESVLEGGLPYIAAMHGDIFYPTFLLRMILPTDIAMTWEFPIHVFLCGLFTYLFLRAWSFGFWGALIGGLAYMLGGSIAGYAYAGHDGKLFVSTMLPLALLLLTRGIRDGRRWAGARSRSSIGLAVLSPHPQLLQYMLLTARRVRAVRRVRRSSGRGTAAARRRRSSAWRSPPAPSASGMLIGAIQYWPRCSSTSRGRRAPPATTTPRRRATRFRLRK